MMMGSILGNSLQNLAGAQNVFHGALAPGGCKYAEMIASKLVVQSCLV